MPPYVSADVELTLIFNSSIQPCSKDHRRRGWANRVLRVDCHAIIAVRAAGISYPVHEAREMRTRTKRRRVSRDADQPILLAALRAERGKEFRASHFKHTGVPKKYVRRALTTDRSEEH